MNLCSAACGQCGQCFSECPTCGREHEPPDCSDYELCPACGEPDCECAYWQTCAVCLHWNCECDDDTDVTWDELYERTVTLPDGESRG